MRISEAAKAAGVGVETIRFYEKKGLIPQPLKPACGGMRDYSHEIVDRIRFVRQAQHIGFSLREISELLSLRADPGSDCADVRGRAIEKRDEVQAKLDQLTHMRYALDELIARCPGGGDVRACTILEAMDRGAMAATARRSRSRTESPKGGQGMKTTILHIGGMHCDGCARTVEALLSRVPGVRKAEASFDQGRARVLHDQTDAPVADLMAAVAKGGFEIKATDQ